MRDLPILFFLLLLGISLCAQEELPEPTVPLVSIVNVGTFSTSGNTFTGTLNNWRDVYNTGYFGTSAQVGDHFLDGGGRLYEITSITSATAVSLNVVLTSVTSPAGSPIGTGQVFRPLENGQYPVAPTGASQIGSYLQGLVLSHNANRSGAGSIASTTSYVPRDTVMSSPGISLSATITGPPPTLTGSAGSYTLTIPEGGDWIQATIAAPSAAAATSGNDLSFVVVNENPSLDRSCIAITDAGTNQIITAPRLEYGILVSQIESGSNTVTTSFSGIGGLSGFTIKFLH